MSDLGKGKAKNISGIPLPGTIPQLISGSAEPNRDEPPRPFDGTDRGESYARDYFDDEQERLGNLNGPYVADKSGAQWSAGIADEENPEEDVDDEGLFPETQPLHADLDSIPKVGEEDSYDMILDPDNAEHDNAL